MSKLVLLMCISKDGSVERDLFQRDHVVEGVYVYQVRSSVRIIIWEKFLTRWRAALKCELDDTFCQ
jgi:hypothetical protein